MNRTVENGRGTLHLRRLVADIVSGAAKNHPEAIRAWRAPREDLRRVATRDYVRQLRRHLGYRELQEMLRLARQVWPGFNRRQLTAAPRELFPTRAARVAGQLRIHLQVKPCGGRDEIALRGFYVEQRPALLERPLIFVNSAHHPGAVSTTFCHEIGHHLTAPLFEHARSPVHFFFDSAYAAHLNDPAELAADAICSLAGYPHPLAVQIFFCSAQLGSGCKGR